VAKAKLDSYENQALLSVALCVVGAISAAALAFFVLGAYEPDLGVRFQAGGRRWYAIIAASALALASSAIGLVVGFNSAGQKSNKLNERSWAGFFLNAGVFTAALCVFVFFWLMKLPVR
jgi:hypothetical protein